MTTQDTRGRTYLKLSEAKAGQMVLFDGGFTCHEVDMAKLFADRGNGRLFFLCNDGRHYISGQADDGEHCVGMFGE